MQRDNNFEHLQMDFLCEDDDDIRSSNRKVLKLGTYKLMIADDDKEVHLITKMILKDFTFEGHKLEFIHAYSGEETKRLLVEHPDTAILFLDVVMESHHSGLDVVVFLREVLKNEMTRVVLRTGQPGEAPEEEVIKQYDINDYRLKTELTLKRMHTTLYTALRNFRDLQRLQGHKKGLEKIIEASSALFQQNQLDDFLTTILSELSNFYQEQPGIIYMRDNGDSMHRSGFVTIEHHRKVRIVAATGKYHELIGQEVKEIPELVFMSEVLSQSQNTGYGIELVEGGFVIRSSSSQYVNNYIFIEGDEDLHDFQLIETFLHHYGIAFDKFLAKNLQLDEQNKLLNTYRSVVERQFKRPLQHSKLVTDYILKISTELKYSEIECEMLAHAASLHDIGMVRIPEHLLLRSAPLTKEEYEIVKKHTDWGCEILSENPDDEFFQLAADIAKAHHENYDGTGYPNGLAGEEIPKSARIMAIVDVFVSMINDKVYGLGKSEEEALAYLNAQRGKRFDSVIVDAFLKSINS